MKETIFLLYLFLAFALLNAHYFKGSPYRYYNDRMVKFTPKDIWGQTNPSKSDQKELLPLVSDQFPAASDHEYNHHQGRVQIKVYRGPDDDHHDFAPYGFWIKQPADDGY